MILKHKRTLQCKTAGCESTAFNITIVVGPDGEVSENPRKIDGEYFECCECFNTAEWVEE